MVPVKIQVVAHSEDLSLDFMSVLILVSRTLWWKTYHSSTAEPEEDDEGGQELDPAELQDLYRAWLVNQGLVGRYPDQNVRNEAGVLRCRPPTRRSSLRTLVSFLKK